MSRPLKTGRVIGRMRQRAQNRRIEEMNRRDQALRLDALLSPYNTAAYRKFTDDRTDLYNRLAALNPASEAFLKSQRQAALSAQQNFQTTQHLLGQLGSGSGNTESIALMASRLEQPCTVQKAPVSLLQKFLSAFRALLTKIGRGQP